MVLVDRANYGRLKPVLREIESKPGLELQIVAAGTMVLERFGQPVRVVKADGFEVHGEIYIEVEGSTPATMAKSIGFAVMEFASEFQRLKPDLVVVIGDRYEALAAALSAAYMNICIVHIQGGEVSGSIDESARHAITKLSHFHFPATRRSAEYLVRMGERPDSILGTGCPSSDIARQLNGNLDRALINNGGSGPPIDIDKPFLLVVFHPTTTSYGGERAQMSQLLTALETLAMPTLMLWPNIDAGSERISKAIRIFRDQGSPSWLRTITNLPPEEYLKALSRTACAVGNSSSFVRDASFFGTPVVMVGDRQEGREVDKHVALVPALAPKIYTAIRKQLKHGRYRPSTLYGDGHVAARIAGSLAELTPYVQKRLHYIYEGAAAPPVNGHASTWNRYSAGRVEGDSLEEHSAAAG